MARSDAELASLQCHEQFQVLIQGESDYQSNCAVFLVEVAQ
ncbi:hypothetical protein [Allocoleopsis franciscana]|nr:hypothetical protein [Allocoleopsis franciscana]